MKFIRIGGVDCGNKRYPHKCENGKRELMGNLKKTALFREGSA